MQRDDQGPDRRGRQTADQPLGTGWAMVGASLFLLALATPITLINFHVIPAEGFETDSAAPVTLAVSPPINPSQTTGEAIPLADRLTNGQIVPGQGVGDIRIGAPVDTLFASIAEAPVVYFDVHEDRTVQHHGFLLDTVRIDIRSDPEIGRIEGLMISASDCADLRTFQPRQNGLPATEDGLSLGSHFSRVQVRLGLSDAQEAVSDSQIVPKFQEVPGMKLTYCGEDMLVGAIAVEGLSDAFADHVPVIAQTAPAEPSFGVTAARPSLASPSVTSSVGVAIAALAVPMSDAQATHDFTAPRHVPVATPVRAVLPPSLTDQEEPTLALVLDRGEDVLPFDGTPWRALAGLTAPVQGGENTMLVASAEEQALGLSRRDRREIQIRLGLIGINTNGVDGIFGPKTREAILALQEAEELPQTGYLDPDMVALLEERTERKYAKLLRDQRRARAATKVEPVTVARVPEARNASACKRGSDGTVIENQSFRCDVAVLEESLRSLFGGSG